MVSLQAFLLLLAFAEQRRKSNSNFILAAEEPELHLHPSLHQRLVHRIRSASVQSIVTTQSPHVAGGYQPSEVIFIQNINGKIQPRQLRNEPIKNIRSNSIRNYYLKYRNAYYEALMGGIILLPEGSYDYEWLCLWQKVAQSSSDSVSNYDLRPITVVPTSDASVVESFQEVAKVRPDVIPLIDGDSAGNDYLIRLRAVIPSPTRIIRYGSNAAIECLAAWILEPALAAPGPALKTLLSDPKSRALKDLQNALINNKKDSELRENLVWESLDAVGCCERACEFFHDIATIATDAIQKNANWQITNMDGSLSVFMASHIKRV